MTLHRDTVFFFFWSGSQEPDRESVDMRLEITYSIGYETRSRKNSRPGVEGVDRNTGPVKPWPIQDPVRDTKGGPR